MNSLLHDTPESPRRRYSLLLRVEGDALSDLRSALASALAEFNDSLARGARSFPDGFASGQPVETKFGLHAFEDARDQGPTRTSIEYRRLCEAAPRLRRARLLARKAQLERERPGRFDS